MRMPSIVTVISISLVMPVPSAFAKTNNHSSSKSVTLPDISPNWYKESNKYKPCPSEVVLKGRVVCLGLPN
jgi:hypothetical protein